LSWFGIFPLQAVIARARLGDPLLHIVPGERLGDQTVERNAGFNEKVAFS
jgi:hypothetical protein